MCKFRDYDNYEVYDDGRIYSYKSKKFLKPKLEKYGYQRVGLYDNEGKRKMYYLHRVVWESVTGEQIPPSYEINHISEVRTENMITNLELVSHKQNINYGSRTEKASKSLTNNKKLSKQVGAFKDGKLILTFPSAKEAERQGFCHSAVSKCCNGKLPHYKGYQWRFI